jgi:hypothetical protein
MKNFFTLHDFFLLSQNESEEWEKQVYGNAGFFSSSEKEKSDSSNQSAETVDTLISPDKKVIDNIMGYAHALYLVKTENAGYFSIVMN